MFLPPPFLSTPSLPYSADFKLLRTLKSHLELPKLLATSLSKVLATGRSMLYSLEYFKTVLIIKILLCADKDSFPKSGHILCFLKGDYTSIKPFWDLL